MILIKHLLNKANKKNNENPDIIIKWFYHVYYMTSKGKFSSPIWPQYSRKMGVKRSPLLMDTLVIQTMTTIINVNIHIKIMRRKIRWFLLWFASCAEFWRRGGCWPGWMVGNSYLCWDHNFVHGYIGLKILLF